MTNDKARADLANTGTLRVAINLGNMLLVTDRAVDGTPVGVAPDLARAVAGRLDVPVTYHCYDQAGQTGDAISNADVDIGLIAHEPVRAETIGFSTPYCEIEATYLVHGNSPICAIEDVDKPSIRIAVADRAAYELYLSRTLHHAELVRRDGLPETVEMFLDDKLDVLAGLRPALLDNAKTIPGARVLDGNYMTVQQCIGTQLRNTAGRRFLEEFAREAKESGLVADLIERHGVTGRLIVAR